MHGNAKISDVIAILRDPGRAAHAYLRQDVTPVDLLLAVVLPAVSIRAIAILARALALHFVGPGVVLALGSVLLQGGTWLGLALVLPPLARSFAMSVDERQAFLLSTAICAPLWAAGVFYIFPEDPPLVLFVTRALVLIGALWGIYVFGRAIESLPGPTAARRLVVLGTAGAYLVIYLVLFTFIGITANVVLFFTG